jgi:hypothetical protein
LIFTHNYINYFKLHIEIINNSLYTIEIPA